MLQKIRTSLAGPMDTLPVLRSRPRVLLHCLRTAVRPFALLVATAVFVLWVAPPLHRAVARQLVPDQSFVERVGSLFGGDDPGARRAAVEHRLGALAWILGLGAVLTTYWLDLPAGLQRASRRSRQQADLADRISGRSAREGLRLYEGALHLATDPESIASLTQRIQALRSRVHPPDDGAAIGGRYRLVESLSRGANGVVHRAEDLRLDRAVALKELTVAGVRDADRTRFRQEAHALARLSHPHVVAVHDLLEHDGRLWIAMELVEGGDLARHLEQHGRLAPRAALRVADMIADALAAAHDQGIVHRDLKALNVLLTPDGRVKVADFGTAKLDASTVQTVEGTVLGTPHCMSPEQVRGEPVDERTDVYALGVLLYQMLLGRPPFDGEMTAVLSQHLHREPPAVHEQADAPDVPAALGELVWRMMAKDPQQRPASMHVVRRELRALKEAVPSEEGTAFRTIRSHSGVT